MRIPEHPSFPFALASVDMTSHLIPTISKTLFWLGPVLQMKM
jgi:hypothetical protein